MEIKDTIQKDYTSHQIEKLSIFEAKNQRDSNKLEISNLKDNFGLLMY